MTSDKKTNGVWKSGKGKGRKTPKGRQVTEEALLDIKNLLGDRERRADLLIEFLHLVQDKFNHLSTQHLAALAEELRLSQTEVYEVASFYAHFDIIKEGEDVPPSLTIRVCDSLSCELAGAQDLLRKLGAKYNGGGKVRVLRAPCMGRCDMAPTLEIGHNHIDYADDVKVSDAISTNNIHAIIPDYETLDVYLCDGGYRELQALRSGSKTPDQVQDEVLDSGLRGLGGAGFPSGKKWSFVRMNEGIRYLAVNGDEGEPGTFKDRYYLEREPHVFFEGMLIAAWAVEAEKCYIYMRDEYPAVLQILATEIAALEAAGLVAKGYIELRRGAGAYICGEESAMTESIEGKRGLPRHRPPFVAAVGIHNRPTLVHNVETLLWVARIVREGPECLNAVEHNGRRGLRSYSVSGRVKNPGVFLLPSGSTITDIIAACGGMLEGHRFKAYQPGGPSSGLVPASIHDVPLDFDTLQPLGTFIGSAAVVVLSEQDSARGAALNMVRFFEDESCGQCTPCRVGCEKAVKLMGAKSWDQSLLSELTSAMADTSICGLGQAAPNPIQSVIKHFSEEI